MNTFYYALKVPPTKMGDICRLTKVTTPNQLVDKKIEFDILIEAADTYAFKIVNKATSNITAESNKQLEFSKDHSNMMIPTEVIKLEPYIIIEFKSEEARQFFKIPVNTVIKCKAYMLCKYYTMMTNVDLKYLIEGSEYVQSQEFKDTIKSINPDATIGLNALRGVRIDAGNIVIDITCGFRCIMVKSKSGDNIYETLSIAWNNYMASQIGKAFKERVSKCSGLDTIAYITVVDYSLVLLLKDQQFMKKIMHSV